MRIALSHPVSKMHFHQASVSPVTNIHSGDDFLWLQPLNKTLHFQVTAVFTVRNPWNENKSQPSVSLLSFLQASQRSTLDKTVFTIPIWDLKLIAKVKQPPPPPIFPSRKITLN